MTETERETERETETEEMTGIEIEIETERETGTEEVTETGIGTDTTGQGTMTLSTYRTSRVTEMGTGLTPRTTLGLKRDLISIGVGPGMGCRIRVQVLRMTTPQGMRTTGSRQDLVREKEVASVGGKISLRHT
jgi:hypothetical protein